MRKGFGPIFTQFKDRSVNKTEASILARGMFSINPMWREEVVFALRKRASGLGISRMAVLSSEDGKLVK